MKMILANNLVLFTLLFVLLFGAVSFSLARVFYKITR
jgi:hypothetical protein